jgi:NADH:ubiquinone oxidoreductase subunit H
MKVSGFELRHQRLVHQFVVAAALLTYLFDRNDIVWLFVKNSTAPREMERALFIIATLVIAVGAGVCTWAGACRRPQSATGVRSYRSLQRPLFLGDLLYAIGLASLFPLPGFIILVGGEALRVFRRIGRADDHAQSLQQNPWPAPALAACALETESGSSWVMAFRKEAAKWGIFLTMIVFVITLKDRLAEYLAAASFLAGLLLNAPFFSHSPSADESS